MQHILDAFRQYAPIGEAAQADLAQMLVREELPKGTILLEAGRVCHRLHFLERGMARSFYLQDCRDITAWFAFEGEVALSMYSFATRKPAFETIELLENSVLYSLEYEQLQYLYATHAEINTIGRLLNEKYYVELEERTLALQFMPAKERYEHLIERKPQVLLRAQLGHIASYLGISPETLSRIRGRQ